MALRDQRRSGVVPVPPVIAADVAGERWRNALAALNYAERHGSPADEVEQLSNRVIEARVAMFQAGIAGDRALPAYLQVITLP